MQKTLVRSVFAAMFTVILVRNASAQLPAVISYQGRLTDAAGAAAPDSVYSLTFTLYDSAQGGAALWTETQPAAVHGGLFSVELGVVNSLSLPFASPYWLGVAVGGGAELLPRTLLAAAPYAMRSAAANRATAADSAGVAARLSSTAGVVTALNGKSGALVLVGSGATSVTGYGDSIVIASSGSGGPTGVQTIHNTDGSIAIGDSDGPIATIGIANAGVAERMIANGAVTPAKVDATGAANGEALMYNGSAVVWGNPAAGNLALPFSQSVNAGAAAFAITNNGNGDALSGTSDAHGVSGASTNGVGVYGSSTTGVGVAGKSSSSDGVSGASTNGDGLAGASANSYGVYGTSTSGNAGYFSITSAANSVAALVGYTKGTGSAGLFTVDNVNGSAAAIVATMNGVGDGVSSMILNPANAMDAGLFMTNGSGNALKADYIGGGVSAPAGNNIAVFQTNGVNMARIDNTGKGFFDGGTQNFGADIAESFAVVGDPGEYRPGDVLVIAADADRRVAKSAGAYSPLVAGVYAAKPGVLLTDSAIDSRLAGMIPVGVIGVIPTNVCCENGPIRRGDLLVTSSIAGCAMKLNARRASAAFPIECAVIGKALQDFDGKGVGKINVLVNVK